ncbi:MAG: helix-turn-helix domain-containing protein [Candidatus Hodarchaeales archaeon]|jgi:predicted transcriptional regulator
MGWQRRIFHKRTVVEIILIGGIILISCNLSIMGIIGNGELEEGTIAVFFGSAMDKKLSQEMVGATGRAADYYNISAIQANQSFIFENESITAIWWVNELPLPIDLTFVGDINEWKQMGRGLFVLNRFFNETPLQDLAHLGITAYAPVVYPLNGSFVEQELSLVEEQLSILNLSKTIFDFNGSAAWVEVNNETRMLAEIAVPEVETILGDLKSGIWLADNRVIVGSFSIEVNSKAEESELKLHGIGLTPPEDIIDLLGQLAQLTIGTLPSDGDNNYLQFGGVDQLAAMGFIAIAGFLSVFVLMKLGVISKIREIIVGVFMSLVLFIAHVAYSPQRRRISEVELLDNQMRVQIVDFLDLKGEQGAHLREIQREVGCGISSLLWHLQALDDFDLVTHEKIGKYHIFYLMGVKSVQTSEMALALKSEVAKELCRVLIRKQKPLSLSKISQEVDVHHSSAQHHIKKLVELGIIITLREKKRSKYIIGPKRLTWLKNHLEVA